MEGLIFTVLVCLWWLSSLTVLLPFLLLLYFNKSFRDKYFAIFMSSVIEPLFKSRFVPFRKRMFKMLEDHLPKRNKSVPLEVLEIGIGAGANLQFYPENSNLTALDMNPAFIKIFNDNKSNYPQVNYKQTILNVAENMTDVEDSSFDVVVSTHVLCSVQNVESVLKEIKRVLKPGGKYVFLEHQAYPQNNPYYLIQLFAAPLWKIYFAGCNLVGNIADPLKKTGFKEVAVERIFPQAFWLLFRSHLIGIATK